MNEFDTVQLIAPIGWLVLAVGALASFRLSFGKGVKLLLIWGSIFATVFLVFSFLGIE